MQAWQEEPGGDGGESGEEEGFFQERGEREGEIGGWVGEEGVKREGESGGGGHPGLVRV